MKSEDLLPISLSAPRAEPLELPRLRNWPRSFHVFDAESVHAVNMALITGRPLLLRGEPGGGKSQLARAAAQALKRPFLSRVVNARLEPEDLLYRFDAVARLSEAQVRSGDPSARDHLKPSKFLLPEILWWAFNPVSAAAQFDEASALCGESVCRYDRECGAPLHVKSRPVILIDEIDKADSEVPNSLLEVFSLGGFQLPFGGGWVAGEPDAAPLILITTNEDRELPAAFLRRCLVHQMDLPGDSGEMRTVLERRVRAHESLKALGAAVLDAAISLLQEDRAEALRRDLKPPGQAELLDLLHAVVGAPVEDQGALLQRLRSFAFRKHREG